MTGYCCDSVSTLYSLGGACLHTCAINPLPFDCKTQEHNGTNEQRGSDWLLFMNNWLLMCTEPRLSHNNVSTPEQASIPDEKVRSDRVERLFFSVADSMGITGRREFKWHRPVQL